MRNEMNLEFESKSQNESFARIVAAAFVTQTNPTLEEIDDIKTVVSEAVTNAIIHGYNNKKGNIFMQCIIEDRIVHITIMDHGIGMDDVEKARQPMYSSKSKEGRSGMGFTFMETLMDDVEVFSKPGIGTTVKMKKYIGC